MLRSLLTLILTVLITPISFAENEFDYRIFGNVSVDGSAMKAFDVSQSEGNTVKREISSGVFLQISALNAGVDEQVNVRVIRLVKGEERVLKEITSSGYKERSWSFAICDNNILQYQKIDMHHLQLDRCKNLFLEMLF